MKALWWVSPNDLAGMPMPFIDPERRENLGGPLGAYDDELPELHAAGIRAVVCLLNIPGDVRVYESAGFAFHLMPVPDGHAPSMGPLLRCLGFLEDWRSRRLPVAVHCAAGLGRTGTVLAACLIHRGLQWKEAIQAVRQVQPAAIETHRQVEFLKQLSDRFHPSPGEPMNE